MSCHLMSGGLKISQKRKEILFAKKIKCSSDINTNQFKLYNKIYNKLRRSAKKMYYDKQFLKFARNSKQIWSVIREVIGTRKQKDQMPKKIQNKCQIITDSLEIANGFNTKN